jgi:cytoskeletal protein CcmA (bactofilin family)
MIFRKDTRNDAFHRQLSNLRQQLAESTASPDSALLSSSGDSDEATFSLDIPPDAFAPARPIAGRLASNDTETIDGRGVTSAVPLDAATTVLSAQDHWEGTLRSQGSVTIRGRLKGQVHATKDVTIDQGAEVEAEIYAQNILIHGTVRGRIEASGRLEILPTGRVVGDVKAPSLVIHEGAKLSGQLRMGRGSETSAPDPASA